MSTSNNSDQPDAEEPSMASDGSEFISKTALKREAERLQQLGKRIAALSGENRADLALPEKLLHAIQEYNRFPSREAKRRQLQYVGRLMRDVDIEPIQSRLDYLDGQSAAAKFTFHQTEHWRERLIEDSKALAEYIDIHPHVDRQQLRHMLKKARSAKNPDQVKIASRALFRFLRETEEAQA